LLANREQDPRVFRHVCNNVAKIRKISEPAMVLAKKSFYVVFFIYLQHKKTMVERNQLPLKRNYDY